MSEKDSKDVSGSSGICQILRHATNHPGLVCGTDGTVLSTKDLLKAIKRVRAQVEKDLPGNAKGRVIGLRAENGTAWVVGLLGLLEAGVSPLLVGPESPDAEAERLLCEANGEGWIEPNIESILITRGAPLQQKVVRGEPFLLMATSGSTGRPSLVKRSESDLISEGIRYRDGVGVRPNDRVLLPLPMSHSYALGWLFGTLIVGATVIPARPTALRASMDLLAGGVTIIALTPSIARLLTQRAIRSRPHAPQLRMAMIGAGPVDGELERSVRRSLGIPTSRNYGSTETGALCAGVAEPTGPGLEPGCVGETLPGIAYEIVDDSNNTGALSTGLLRVRTAAHNEWYDTGDLVTDTPAGLQILGRRANAVRRGDRWVAPLEVESVLLTHPGVLDVHVTGRPGRYVGADRLIADVVLDNSTPLEAVRQHIATHLSSAKRPDELREREDLWRSTTGKVQALPRPVLTKDGLAATRAYKASELLFSFRELGILELLDGDHDVIDLAQQTGCSTDRLRELFSVATDLGLLTNEPDSDRAEVNLEDALRFVDLEAFLSRSWTSRNAFTALARGDTHPLRPFDLDTPHAEFIETYQQAMESASAHARSLLGIRLLRAPRGARVLEVTAGPGRYLPTLLDADPELTGHLVPVGPLSGPPHPALIKSNRVSVSSKLDIEEFDVCIVANAVHGPTPGDNLSYLLSRLRPGGKILIDDIFLPEGGGRGTELALDWHTHGGTSWTHLKHLVEALTARGARVDRDLKLPGGTAALVLATNQQVTNS